MRLRKTTHLAWSLLFAAGLGVFSAQAQTASANKTATSKTGASAHKGKSSRKTARKSSGREKGQKAPTADRITEIQQALAKDGSFAGAPNGKWDAATTDAMRKFQGAHGLNASGKLDAKTLQQLGLGSQTAGVAAPMPPTSSPSAKVTPAQTISQPR